MNMYKCLSAIMHLGNVNFSENDSEQSAVKNKSQLQVVTVSVQTTIVRSLALPAAGLWVWPVFISATTCLSQFGRPPQHWVTPWAKTIPWGIHFEY